MKKATGNKGFTLIELLIVIAVIAILAALAIPNLLSSRKAANETAAIAQLKTISSAEETFKIRNMGASLATPRPNGYATVAELETAKLVQWPTPGTFQKNGYTFSDLLAAPTTTDWGVLATPGANAGDRMFAITMDNFVRGQVSTGTPPTDIATAQALNVVQ
jgi:prepilin-type N-terminal cleavage/methylation domain-containing protein